MKAKDFWEFLCNEMDYRFFTGVPCMGLKTIYDKMSSKLMYYVPATKESVALGIASGVSLSGIRSAVLININRVYNLMDWLTSFNLEYNIPLLIIAAGKKEDLAVGSLFSTYKIPCRNLKTIGDIKYITNKIKKFNKPGVLFVGEGVVSK